MTRDTSIVTVANRLNACGGNYQRGCTVEQQDFRCRASSPLAIFSKLLFIVEPSGSRRRPMQQPMTTMRRGDRDAEG